MAIKNFLQNNLSWKRITTLFLFVLTLLLNLQLVKQGIGRLYEADFIRNTWLGGYLILNGQNPYDPGIWQNALSSFVPHPEFFPCYIYPIWVAILAAPLGMLKPLHALALWTTINLFFLYHSIKIVFRLLKKPLSRSKHFILIFLSFLFVPTILHLLEGQYNILILYLFLISMLRIQSHPSLISGLILSFTLGKPQSSWLFLGAILWWLLWRRRWKEFVGFVFGCALLWLTPLIIFPNWLGDWISVSHKQSIILIEMAPSIIGLFNFFFEASVANPLASSLSLLILLGFGWWWYRKVLDPSTQVWESTPFVIVGLLTSFYGLLYEQIVLLLPFLLCWEWAYSRTWRLILIIWIIAIPFLTFMIFAINPPYNLVFSVLSLLSLLPIYFFLRSKIQMTNFSE